MQTSLEQKVHEVKIDQTLAALKEISEQKDQVDKQISDLLMTSNRSSLDNWSMIKLSALKRRRERLLAMAEEIMRVD